MLTKFDKLLRRFDVRQCSNCTLKINCKEMTKLTSQSICDLSHTYIKTHYADELEKS